MRNREREEVKGGFPEPWKPAEVGETIEGIFVGIDLVPDGRKGEFISYRIMDEESEELRSVSGAMLQTSLGRVPYGTYVWITYVGTERLANGLAKVYKVEMEKGVKLRNKPHSVTNDE